MSVSAQEKQPGQRHHHHHPLPLLPEGGQGFRALTRHMKKAASPVRPASLSAIATQEPATTYLGWLLHGGPLSCRRLPSRAAANTCRAAGPRQAPALSSGALGEPSRWGTGGGVGGSVKPWLDKGDVTLQPCREGDAAGTGRGCAGGEKQKPPPLGSCGRGEGGTRGEGLRLAYGPAAASWWAGGWQGNRRVARLIHPSLLYSQWHITAGAKTAQQPESRLTGHVRIPQCTCPLATWSPVKLLALSSTLPWDSVSLPPPPTTTIGPFAPPPPPPNYEEEGKAWGRCSQRWIYRSWWCCAAEQQCEEMGRREGWKKECLLRKFRMILKEMTIGRHLAYSG